MDDKASKSDKPIALSTCEGLEVTAEQAEPLDTEIVPNRVISWSDSTPLKQMFVVLNNRWDVLPFMNVSGIARSSFSR